MMHWYKTVVSFKVIYSRTSYYLHLARLNQLVHIIEIMFVATFIVSMKKNFAGRP